MYIKEVIIDGFKSYAQRTNVEGFDPLFNAITGLNGSGKSNILDAICFVLGLSNLSQVRATNLQELVYKNGQAGIQKASVTIIFDNTDKNQSPVGYENFDELTITRQVVVGGRNRYLINGSNANNNRVSDLFRSVQLNINNPHFLIMQGRITKVLNMKPQEILSMIEEAAGTSLYESKKQSALKTIEKKDNKLQDINKILQEEINPTLEKLKTERSSYLEYQKIQREIETLTRLVVAYKFTRALKLDENAEEEVNRIQKEVSEVEEEAEKGKAEISRIKEEICKLEEKKKSGSRMQQLEQQVSEYSKREVKAKSDLDNILDSVKQEEKSKESIVKSIKSNEALINSKSEELKALSAEVEELRKVEEADALSLQNAESNLTAVQAGQLEKGDSGQMTYTESLIKLKDELSEAQTQNKQAQMKLKHSQSAIKKMEQSCKQAEKEIAKEKHDFELSEKAVANIEKKIASLGYSEEEYSSLKEEKQNLELKIDKTGRAVSELYSKYPHLQFEYQDPERNFDRRRVKGLVAELFTVPDAAYCTALEVAAGSRLYNVVTDNEHTSSLLIKHGQLRTRYVMIPLSKIRSNVISDSVVANAKQLVGEKNVHRALDVIKFDKDVTPAMKYCFGSVLICRTKEQAKLVAFDNSVRRKVITLEGDVYDPSGTLTGGSRNTSKSVLKDLAVSKTARLTLSDSKKEHRAIDQKLAKLTQLSREHDDLAGQLRLKSHERDLLKERLQQTSHFKDIEELRQTKQDLQKQQEIVDNFAKRETELLKKCAEVEKKMKNFKQEQEKELQKAQKLIADAKAKAVKSSKATKSLQGKLRELELEVSSDLVREIESLRSQIPTCDEKLSELQKQVEVAQQKLKAVSEETRKINADLEKQKLFIRECSLEIEGLISDQKKNEKAIGASDIKKKELNHQLAKVNKDAADAKSQVQHYLNSYDWIASEKQYFGEKDTAYDFENSNIKECDKKLDKLQASKEKLAKSVNMKAMHLLGEAEKRYNDLMKKKDIVVNDKDKINNVIKDLDLKKNKAVRKAWEQVNKDFSSIFSTLLPGAQVKLQTLDGQPVTAGLEVRVGFGDVWKESLTELSGGQRSLVALSLILALLLFKPAPLYILDEVDAALDLSHTQNIGQMLRAHFKKSQFIVVSLKDGMFQNANVLFRTRFSDGVSSVTRHTQNTSSADTLKVKSTTSTDKENRAPSLHKRNKKQRI